MARDVDDIMTDLVNMTEEAEEAESAVMALEEQGFDNRWELSRDPIMAEDFRKELERARETNEQAWAVVDEIKIELEDAYARRDA